MLQWDHDLAAVEGAAFEEAKHPRDELQWGHDLAAVEGGLAERALKERG